MTAKEELLRNIKDTVRRTVATLEDRQPQETLAGYALLTDDDVTTLTSAAVTEEALALDASGDLLFCPTDWPYQQESASFALASQTLRATDRGDASRKRADLAFATLVQALVDLRAEGLFSAGVFLSVLSTDPSPHLEELERSSVQRLNQHDLIAARERFLIRWSG